MKNRVLYLMILCLGLLSFKPICYKVNSDISSVTDSIPYSSVLTSYGYLINRVIIDSVLVLPNGDTTFGTDKPRLGAMVFLNGIAYLYTGAWTPIGAASGSQTLSKGANNDSIFLSNGGGAVLDRDSQQLRISFSGLSTGDTLKLDRSASVILPYLLQSQFQDSAASNRQSITINGDTLILTPPGTKIVLPVQLVTSVNGKQGAVVLTSDSIPQGSVNQYFTITAARSALASGQGINYNSVSGVIAVRISSGTGNQVSIGGDNGLYVPPTVAGGDTGVRTITYIPRYDTLKLGTNIAGDTIRGPLGLNIALDSGRYISGTNTLIFYRFRKDSLVFALSGGGGGVSSVNALTGAVIVPVLNGDTTINDTIQLGGHLRNAITIYQNGNIASFTGGKFVADTIYSYKTPNGLLTDSLATWLNGQLRKVLADTGIIANFHVKVRSLFGGLQAATAIGDTSDIGAVFRNTGNAFPVTVAGSYDTALVALGTYSHLPAIQGFTNKNQVAAQTLLLQPTGGYSLFGYTSSQGAYSLQNAGSFYEGSDIYLQAYMQLLTGNYLEFNSSLSATGAYIVSEASPNTFEIVGNPVTAALRSVTIIDSLNIQKITLNGSPAVNTTVLNDTMVANKVVVGVDTTLKLTQRNDTMNISVDTASVIPTQLAVADTLLKYVRLSPGSQQTGAINISGTLTAGTSYGTLTTVDMLIIDTSTGKIYRRTLPSGGGGGSQNLATTLSVGDSTQGHNIVLNSGDSLKLNGSYMLSQAGNLVFNSSSTAFNGNITSYGYQVQFNNNQDTAANAGISLGTVGGHNRNFIGNKLGSGETTLSTNAAPGPLGFDNWFIGNPAFTAAAFRFTKSGDIFLDTAGVGKPTGGSYASNFTPWTKFVKMSDTSGALPNVASGYYASTHYTFSQGLTNTSGAVTLGGAFTGTTNISSTNTSNLNLISENASGLDESSMTVGSNGSVPTSFFYNKIVQAAGYIELLGTQVQLSSYNPTEGIGTYFNIDSTHLWYKSFGTSTQVFSVDSNGNEVIAGYLKQGTSGDYTARTGAQNPIAIVTADASGVAHSYLIGQYANVVSAPTSTLTIVLECTYTDENNNAQTLTFLTFTVASTTGPSQAPNIEIRVKSGTVITLKTVASGSGSVSYDVGGEIVELR